jgi:hypothetical protein
MRYFKILYTADGVQKRLFMFNEGFNFVKRENVIKAITLLNPTAITVISKTKEITGDEYNRSLNELPNANSLEEINSVNQIIKNN